MLPTTNSVRSVKYVSFLVHLIIFSQLHMFIEYKWNGARHGKISDGNIYTVIWPEGSGKNQQIQNTDSKFSHHKICIRKAKMPTINKNIMLDNVCPSIYLSILFIYLFIYLFIHSFVHSLLRSFIHLIYLENPITLRKSHVFNTYVIRHIQASKC